MARPGPKPLPMNVHILKGNPAKKPLAALLDSTPRPDVVVPPCPRHLSADARAEWRRITPHLVKLGLVSDLDRAVLAAYCQAWGDYVWAQRRIRAADDADPTGAAGRITTTPSGYQQMSVAMQVSNRALEQLQRYAAEFGMSPAERSRVTAGDPRMQFPDEPGEKPADEWKRF